jgi:hypothetical protein
MSQDANRQHPPARPSQLTAGEFKKFLGAVPDTAILAFAGELDFYRIKQRGKDLYVIEFNQQISGNRVERFGS